MPELPARLPVQSAAIRGGGHGPNDSPAIDKTGRLIASDKIEGTAVYDPGANARAPYWGV